MIYDITQTTRYSYGEPVPFSRHIIRMQPVTRAGQNMIHCTLHVEPAPVETSEARDFFGNAITRIAIADPHDALAVTVKARVHVAAPDARPAHLSLPWEEVAALALADRASGATAPVHGLFPSRIIAFDPAITAYAAESFTPGRPVLAAVDELNERIRRDFFYDPMATSVDTDPAHAFGLRRGVCQDFAHIMIAGLRGLGLPALYVSGWLRTVPPPGEARLAGADATHAWVALWAGAAGWIGFDPTNGIRAGADHVILAEGRDYADIAPLDGIIWSPAGHALSVAVDVIPVGEDRSDAR